MVTFLPRSLDQNQTESFALFGFHQQGVRGERSERSLLARSLAAGWCGDVFVYKRNSTKSRREATKLTGLWRKCVKIVKMQETSKTTCHRMESKITMIVYF
uniref:(northern house mosquito) hypothetical protein n=1 Tax=Culex pipiens TaxID=7175 RepID=A0A8D8HLQ2_CULPI